MSVSVVSAPGALVAVVVVPAPRCGVGSELPAMLAGRCVVRRDDFVVVGFERLGRELFVAFVVLIPAFG